MLHNYGIQPNDEMIDTLTKAIGQESTSHQVLMELIIDIVDSFKEESLI